MSDKEAETARLKALMAPVEDRILQLLDKAKPATFIYGRNLAKLYEAAFGTPLDPQQLTGQTDLRQMLGRRNLLPRTGVKGSGEQWYVYRLLQSDAAGASHTRRTRPLRPLRQLSSRPNAPSRRAGSHSSPVHRPPRATKAPTACARRSLGPGADTHPRNSR